MIKTAFKTMMTLSCSLLLLPLASVRAEDGVRSPVGQDLMGQYPYNLTYAINVNKSNAQKMRGTGTLIGNNWMLTAGHMVTDRKGVLGGQTTVEGETNGTTHTISLKSNHQIKVNPGYAGFSDLRNDVSLIKITSPSTVNTPQVPITVYRDPSALVGQRVSTMGYSSYYYGDYTETSGQVLKLEDDGTLTVNMPVAQQNSGSPVYLNGEMIGVLTATGPGSGYIMGDTATVTPFTESIKANLFDPNGIPASLR